MIPVYLALNDLMSVVPAICLGYYAVKMFILTRMGRLERGWSLIIFGCFACSLGFCVLAIQDLTLAYTLGYMVTDYAGTLLSALGLFLVMLGVRSHYSVWSLKSFSGMQKEKKEEPTKISSP
jgi:hypothetical protein